MFAGRFFIKREVKKRQVFYERHFFEGVTLKIRFSLYNVTLHCDVSMDQRFATFPATWSGETAFQHFRAPFLPFLVTMPRSSLT